MDWCRYHRALYFEGYSPPVFPHIDFRAERYVDIARRLGANVIRFQPIGYYACYPSRFFRVHPELGDRDLLREMVDACSGTGVSVYAYVGFNHPHLEPEEVNNPRFADWIARAPDGSPLGVWWHVGFKQNALMCVNSPSYQESLLGIVEELCAYDVVGLYFDRPGAYVEVCFCERCRREFHKATGFDLMELAPPEAGGPKSPDHRVRKAWYDWIHEGQHRLTEKIAAILKSHGKAFLAHGNCLRSTHHYRKYLDCAAMAMVEHAETLEARLWAGSAGEAAGPAPQIYVGSFSIGQPAYVRNPAASGYVGWYTAFVDSEEILMEGFATLAAGNSPLYGTPNRLDYKQPEFGTEHVREVFGFMAEHEAVLKDSKPVAHVKVMLSTDTVDWYGPQVREREGFHGKICEEAFSLLLWAGVASRVELDFRSTLERLQEAPGLYLPSVACMSDEAAALIREYVARGGGLIATGETSLYDEEGRRRDDYALADVFGAHAAGTFREPYPERYLRILKEHPATGNLRPGLRLLNDMRPFPIAAESDDDVVGEVWNQADRVSEGPGLIARAYGKGRVVFIPSMPERAWVETGVDHLVDLIRSCIAWAGNAPLPHAVLGPKGVHGILRETKDGDRLLFVLANVGHKSLSTGRRRQQYLPVEGVEARILVPQGRKVVSVRGLRSGREYEVKCDAGAEAGPGGGYASVVLPRVHIAEVLHWRLA